jgi:branched-chain amino acid transport system permease protein
LTLRRCGGLPAGSRRRIEIARALARRPAVLLLDEPAAGLTDAEKAELGALIGGLAGEGVAVLLVEHDLAFLTGCAARILVLDEGRLIADGDPAAALAHPVVRDLFLAEPGDG